MTGARAAGFPYELARALTRLAVLAGIDPARAASMQTEARALNRQLGIRG